MNKIRKSLSTICGLACIVAAIRITWVSVAQGRDLITTVILTLVLLGWGFGLFRQYRWVLRATAYILMLNAIILPIGLFNPFTAGDYLASGIEPPPIGQTLLWLLPVEALLLAIAYLLDPLKTGKN